MITELPGTIAPAPGDAPPGLAADHPMRAVTRAVAFDPNGWSPEVRAQVAELFDSLADEWSTRDVAGREAPVVDAFDRGLAAAPPARRRVGLDIGAGNGLHTRHLAPHLPVLASIDLSLEMLLRAPAEPAGRVQADASVVHGRTAALERAVTNLLDNAAKFDQGDQPIELHIAAGRVEVRDRGPGLQDADIPHLFDRFYRAIDARSRPGSGLGLAIVKDVADSHHGTVFAANRPGGGAADRPAHAVLSRASDGID